MSRFGGLEPHGRSRLGSSIIVRIMMTFVIGVTDFTFEALSYQCQAANEEHLLVWIKEPFRDAILTSTS